MGVIAGSLAQAVVKHLHTKIGRGKGVVVNDKSKSLVGKPVVLTMELLDECLRLAEKAEARWKPQPPCLPCCPRCLVGVLKVGDDRYDYPSLEPHQC